MEPPFKILLDLELSREALKVGCDAGVASIIPLKIQSRGLRAGKEGVRLSGVCWHRMLQRLVLNLGRFS